jgi:hypothetical protein
VDQYFEQIADQWGQRATELAQWSLRTLVNRTDVWGRYLPLRHRTSAQGVQNNAITAPFREERGKVFLGISSLEKHFRTKEGGGVLGIHSTGSDGGCRWLAIDIDLHDEDDLSVTKEGNFVAAKKWWTLLQEQGLDPLFFDSNGAGGFHLWVVFDRPMVAKTVRTFADQLVKDFDRIGLDEPPDIFPGHYKHGHYGSWLRLPGRHHTRQHYTRVWNDEPWADEPWLDGHDAIDRILRTQPASVDVLQSLGLEPRRQTICLDFDGVIHSYRSGWQGSTVIPDPPIHRTKEAVERLRRNFRVVVFSARCNTQEGKQAIENWLLQHEIEVDEVCMHKPPAIVYVDDRAVSFTGDWDETIANIHDFRK